MGKKKEKKNFGKVDSAFLKDTTEVYDVKFQTGKAIKIKIEVDTQPPLHFTTEQKLLLLPESFVVRCFTLPSLFAGKMPHNTYTISFRGLPCQHKTARKRKVQSHAQFSPCLFRAFGGLCGARRCAIVKATSTQESAVQKQGESNVQLIPKAPTTGPGTLEC